MRKFAVRPFRDHVVDLDDPSTYNHLPKDVKSLREMMLAKIGYAYCYMNFWHKDIFDSAGYGQRVRVEALVKSFTENESKHYDNVLWYQEQIFLFEDETENMC